MRFVTMKFVTTKLVMMTFLIGTASLNATAFQGGGELRWGNEVLQQSAEWYRSAAARELADSVIQYQTSEGGWPKNTNLAIAPRTAADVPSQASGLTNTIDNDATTLPLEFLARIIVASKEPKYLKSFERGLDYLFAAQYPNGGWPQFFPLRDGYYSHITFNDNAMIRVMRLLREVSRGGAPYTFVDGRRKARAVDAVARGLDIVLRTQIKQDGKLTVWCAQYDEKTLEPAWARAYEPPSLSGSESVAIVRFLMEIEKPDRKVVQAVEGAVEWLRAAAIRGIKLETFTGADGRRDRRVVADPAAPLLWARFYELKTNRPIFLGRDSVFRYAYGEIEYERRNGYAYYGVWPAALLAGYPKWAEKTRVR